MQDVCLTPAVTRGVQTSHKITGRTEGMPSTAVALSHLALQTTHATNILPVQMMREQRMPSTAVMQEAAEQVVQLKSEIGITRSALKALRAAAATYSDTDYISYTEPMQDALAALSTFCDAYRSQYVPYVQALLHVNRHYVKDVSTRCLSPDEALQRRDVSLQQLGTVQLPQLPDLRHIQWRYPPQQYVWLPRKGRRKQPPPAVPPAPLPAVRDKELLPCEATVLAFD